MLTYPNIDPILVSFGPFAIRWYGLAYIAGLTVPFLIFKKTFRQQLKCSADDCLNFITYLALGIILGGRIGYMLFYNMTSLLADPLTMFAVWQGGMSYHGGIFGAMVATVLFAKNNKKSVFGCLDIVSLGSTIGIGLGRLSNFINGELYGRVTTSAFGMVFPTGGPLPRHPSQLYEAFFEGLVIFVILWAVRKYLVPKPLFIGGLYLILYSSFRFVIEFFRQPDEHIGFLLFNLSMGQLLCLVELIIGVVVLMWVIKHNDTIFDRQLN
tara:strand:- start:160 stop:963 length:804 start_codon:yes stop_codon:yes gene_type:complete